MMEEWTCSQCGAFNETEMGEKKVCVNCGHDEDMYDLPDSDDRPRGIY